MGLNHLLTLLKKHFGYNAFRPLQEEIVSHVVSGKDALVLMPTGGGKSLCFQLPAIYFDGLTLVISPLISLMKDQVDSLTANGVPSAFINSSLVPQEIDDVMNRAHKGKLKILYAAPERLALDYFQSFLQKLQLSLIAIDEAHCISEWGHDFRPDYRNLKSLRHTFPDVPMIALTATATQRVRRDIIDQLSLQKNKIFLASFNRPNLRYSVIPKNNSLYQLLAFLKKYQNEPTIIYCFSRKDTENLAQDLRENGHKALAYHAGMEGSERKITQEKFIRDEVPIIVATIAFGMGIDKPDVRLIVHYHLPKSIEGYYQETGRAGRDGLLSECVLLYSHGDTRKYEYFFQDIEDDKERDRAYAKLDQVVEFCELANCRRKFLLKYFGEEIKHVLCDNCDRCQSPQESFDATEIAQKILSACLRTGERFGVNYVIDVLRGSQTQSLKERGHDKLSVYGLAQNFSKLELKEIIRALITKNILQKAQGEYPTLALTQQGKEFLREKKNITLPKPRAVVEEITQMPSEELSYDQKLFELLRALRRQIAASMNVPPFVVFGDVSLREMATYYPQSAESFLKISGVGKEKLRRYGKNFLRAITLYAHEHNIQQHDEHAVLNRVMKKVKRIFRKDSTYDETKKMVLQKLPLKTIAQRRSLAEGTIVSHIEKFIIGGEDLDIAYLKPPSDRFEKIKEAFKKNQTDALSPMKDFLGDEYSYDEIRLARVFLIQERMW